MKFGKELKQRSVREWEDEYMSYKRLKRIIKKLAVQLKEREDNLLPLPSHPHSPDEDDVDDEEEAALLEAEEAAAARAASAEERELVGGGVLMRDARQEFFEELDKDIQRINTFFIARLDAFDAEYWQLLEGGGSGGPSIEHRRQSSAAAASRNDANIRRLSVSSAASASNPSLAASLFTQPPFLKRSITISNLSLLESRSTAVLQLYRRYLQLLSYSFTNAQGFIKIVKKYDKYGHDSHSAVFHAQLDDQPLVARRTEVEARIEEVEDLYMRVSISRNVEVKKVRQVLRAVQRDVEEGDAEAEPVAKSRHSLLFIALAIIVTLLLSSLPLLPIDEQPAHRCLLLVALVTVLWVTEAVPFFVTSLLIPLLTVLSGILTDANGLPLPADKASKVAFGVMWSDSVVLILGGFSISAAFSKCQYELRVTSYIQQHLGNYPRLFLLAFMLLAAFLSMLISNVASPILLTSLLLPIIRDLQRSSVYARCLLLALAFACNVGGMMSPIASPENAIVLGYLEQNARKHNIDWLQWMALALPLGVLAILTIWAYLCLALLRDQPLPAIPPILLQNEKISKRDVLTLTITSLSLFLWCGLSSFAHHWFGTMATVAIIPLVVFFGSGLLSTADVRGFSWHLILLICGGNVLGEAVRSSRLLALLTDPLIPLLADQGVWVVCLCMIALISVLTSFVPHTVAALILAPVVMEVGAAIHHTHSLVFTLVFMLNLTMSLPISTFPNINSWLVDDDFHRPFLHARDFVRHGVGVTLLMAGMMATIGYTLLRLTFGKSIW